MADYGTDNKSTIWGIAAAAGVVAFLIFKFLMSYAFWPSVFLGLLIAILVALMVWIGFYKPSEQEPVSDQAVAKPAPKPVTAAPAPVAKPEVAAEPVTEATQEEPSKRPDGFANGLMGDAGNRLKQETAAKNSMPKGIDAPRGGQADDLKRIKGIGPKLEMMLNGMGYYHFDQIAEWGPGEVSWVDENLKGFKGRVSRDNWVDQAKLLATGEETEFSKRVDDGNVY